MRIPNAYSVLVVDDEADVRSVMANTLRQQGYLIHEADGATAALELASRERLDAVVTDLNMPGKDGATLCNLLRKLAPTLPVFLVSSNPLFLDKARERCSAQGYFDKFDGREQMMRAIAFVLGLPQPRSSRMSPERDTIRIGDFVIVPNGGQ